ncbi:hypothetical protein ACIQZG_11655 [Lysinibacillus sp. NPDC096418]|uniref:hypothetical protein n=1 Tax=Lysinibacillus sp. NPDC096418 TaxID=3364138 RepID=UPI0037F2920E
MFPLKFVADNTAESCGGVVEDVEITAKEYYRLEDLLEYHVNESEPNGTENKISNSRIFDKYCSVKGVLKMDAVQKFISENQHQFRYIMHEASRQWFEKDKVGALTVGDCNFVVEKHGQYHEILEKMQKYEKALEEIYEWSKVDCVHKRLDNCYIASAKALGRY